jgi:4-hydroxy-2-oxoheptanedioate aldolase
MIGNGLKRLWADGRCAINGWLSIGSAFSAEIMAAQGFDSLTIDLQHGVLDDSHLVPMLQAIRASGVTPMARVRWLDPAAIMRVLDAGAYGVICPMVNSAEEARQLVQHMRYPPLGSRSFGPTRANFSAGSGYAAEANDQVLCLAMIETAAALERVEEIAATPGLDGLYIGPADLTLGVTDGRLAPGFDREEPEMVAAIQRVLGAGKAAGLRVGLHCGTPAYAARAAGWGFDLVTLSNDVRLLATAAAATVGDLRGRLGLPAARSDALDGRGY